MRIRQGFGVFLKKNKGNKKSDTESRQRG